jgi:hypothetical protein
MKAMMKADVSKDGNKNASRDARGLAFSTKDLAPHPLKNRSASILYVGRRAAQHTLYV